MKKLLLFTLAIGTTCFAADVKTPTTLTERFSYAVGMQIGSDFGSKEMEIDFDLFLAGVKAYADDTTLLTKEDANEVLKQAWEDYQAKAKAKRDAKRAKARSGAPGELPPSESSEEEYYEEEQLQPAPAPANG